MNNKGQTLVLFVFLLPIVIIMFVVLVDISRIYYEKSKLDNINMLVLDKYMDKNDREIENIINKNDSNVNEINIDRKNNLITIKKDIKVIFVGILNKNKYEIISKYKLENGRIIKG